MGSNHSKDSPPQLGHPGYKNPHKTQLKLHKNLENKGALKETPCKHDKETLRDQIISMVQGRSHYLPLNGPNKKRSLKKLIVATGTF